MYRKYGFFLLFFILGLNTHLDACAESLEDFGVPKTTTQTDILCPVAHAYRFFKRAELFRKFNPYHKNGKPLEELLVIEFDIDQDGCKDALITANYMENGKQGVMWSVYIKHPTGYEQMDEVLTFSQNSYGLRKHPTQKAAILTRFSSGGGGQWAQEENIISTTGIKSKILHKAKYRENSYNEDAALMKKLHAVHIEHMKKTPIKKMLFSEVETYLETPEKCTHRLANKTQKDTP
jgi:hypothetical protein